MDGRGVYRLATRLVGPVIDEVLECSGWERASVDAVVPHQASRHAVELLWDRFGFARDQAVINLAERGNCLAASTPLAFAEAVHGGRIRRGDRVLLVGTGAGVSVGAIALRY
jgi:3-oxoacyl-[acyl-carrier-protein] synthase-3